MQTALQINQPSNQSRTIRAGAALSTSTSTIMTVLLLASIGQGFISTALLAAAGLGFELLKWSSWQDAWQAHHNHQHDKRNLLAGLCLLAVLLSIGASIATTRSNLAINAGGYIGATNQQQLINDQIRQKREAIDVCTKANRITLCVMPLQAEVSDLQNQLINLEIPAPDEATALINEVSTITGLSFDQAATVVVAIIAIMLDAAGLYFLYKQTDIQGDFNQNHVVQPHEMVRQESEPENLTDQEANTCHIHGDVYLSVSLGIDDQIRKALNLIQSGEVKPTVRNLSESLQLPQHAAQTLLYWLAEAGHIQRQEKGRGYIMPDVKQGELI